MNRNDGFKQADPTSLLIELMMDAYGPLIAGDSLWKVLGYSSAVAMRVALGRDTLPVTSMELPRRQSKFGLVEEIGPWLIEQRLKNCDAEIELNQEWLESVPKERLDQYIRSYGVLLHEAEIRELVGDYADLAFPIFRIDNRRTKLFALLLEVLPFLESSV